MVSRWTRAKWINELDVRNGGLLQIVHYVDDGGGDDGDVGRWLIVVAFGHVDCVGDQGSHYKEDGRSGRYSHRFVVLL